MLCTNSPRNKLTRVLGKALVAHVDWDDCACLPAPATSVVPILMGTLVIAKGLAKANSHY